MDWNYLSHKLFKLKLFLNNYLSLVNKCYTHWQSMAEIKPDKRKKKLQISGQEKVRYSWQNI